MRATFKSVWVRKLIGKLGVPYNRRLRVRGSPHPLDYDAGLSLAVLEIPPVESAQTAVKMAIYSDIKKGGLRLRHGG
jgi:hypothetical protein